jgi:hypothetical protein
MSRQVFWYDKPASRWVEALPVGRDAHHEGPREFGDLFAAAKATV